MQARNFLELGIAVIPIKSRDKRPDARLLPGGKWEPYKTQLPTPDDLEGWLARGMVNYGVIAGWQGLTILDFDNASEYAKWVTWGAKQSAMAHWVYERGLQVRTSRGVHVYIRLPYTERNRKLGKLDVKGNGYVLGPGSIHPDGTLYETIRGLMILPMVEALSDVLPGALLQTATEQEASTQGVALPAREAQTETDPWKTASNPTVPAKGSLVEKVKKALRVEDFFPQRQHTGGNRWYLTRCPFHDDENPSLWIDVDKQLCGCFAGCTRLPLDVINLYARLNGLDNTTAIYELGKMVVK